ncbi:hypothetical protein MTO96_038527 [Rhipicephalus appendiculatus]
MMDTVSVEGELISSEEYNDPGWRAAHERRNKTKKTTGTDERVTNRGDVTASKMRKSKGPRTPQLPEEDYKVVIRPRGGLDMASLSPACIKDVVLRAAHISSVEAERDNASY